MDSMHMGSLICLGHKTGISHVRSNLRDQGCQLLGAHRYTQRPPVSPYPQATLSTPLTQAMVTRMGMVTVTIGGTASAMALAMAQWSAVMMIIARENGYVFQ